MDTYTSSAPDMPSGRPDEMPETQQARDVAEPAVEPAQTADRPDDGPEDAGAASADEAQERSGAAADGPEAGVEIGGMLTALSVLAAERDEYLGDLQRVQADFENYRKRVAADHARQAEAQTRAALETIIPIIDELDRLVESESGSSGAKAVQAAVDVALGRLGLVRVGGDGGPFDPQRHEAVATVAGGTPGTVVRTLRVGWQHGEHTLRPALVEVAA